MESVGLRRAAQKRKRGLEDLTCDELQDILDDLADTAITLLQELGHVSTDDGEIVPIKTKADALEQLSPYILQKTAVRQLEKEINDAVDGRERALERQSRMRKKIWRLEDAIELKQDQLDSDSCTNARANTLSNQIAALEQQINAVQNDPQWIALQQQIDTCEQLTDQSKAKLHAMTLECVEKLRLQIQEWEDELDDDDASGMDIESEVSGTPDVTEASSSSVEEDEDFVELSDDDVDTVELSDDDSPEEERLSDDMESSLDEDWRAFSNKYSRSRLNSWMSSHWSKRDVIHAMAAILDTPPQL